MLETLEPRPANGMDKPTEVEIETLFRIVRRLANQMPTRYFLDAGRDGSFSMVALELWFQEGERCPYTLCRELMALGFYYQGSRRTAGSDYIVRTWQGVRAYPAASSAREEDYKAVTEWEEVAGEESISYGTR